MKTLTLIIGLLLWSAAPAFAMRDYYEQANEQRFDDVHIQMTFAEVHEICGGHLFLPFETIRSGFAFAVDEKRSGILALPWHIDLNQMVDFFTSSKRALVVFYKEGKVDGIMVFDFSKSKWENRSRPAANKAVPNHSTKPTPTSGTSAAEHPPRQP